MPGNYDALKGQKHFAAAVSGDIDQPDDPMSDDDQVFNLSLAHSHLHHLPHLQWINFQSFPYIPSSKQMIVADDSGSMRMESTDIDLKCAEKVTDSDSEETHTTAEDIKPTISGILAVDAGDSGNGSQSTDNSKSQLRDFTISQPKAIKAQRQIDNTLPSYQEIPFYAFNSPKNPTGILPFQPTGNDCAMKMNQRGQSSNQIERFLFSSRRRIQNHASESERWQAGAQQ